MSEPNSDRLLEDLALLYIALAHGTDHHFAKSELVVMTDKLQRHLDGYARETILAAIEHALASYEQPDIEERLDVIIARLYKTLSPAQLEWVLDDMTAIALADDKYLHVENSFIDKVLRTWQQHPVSSQRQERLWSILNTHSEDASWTIAHDLTLIYLMFAHQSNQELANIEIVAITKKIAEWLPNAHGTDVADLVMDALKVYATGPDPARLDAAIRTVRDVVPVHQRLALLSDLQYIACADRRMQVEEKAFIARLAAAWDVPFESQL